MSDFKRGTRVYFHGRMGIKDLITYVWVVLNDDKKTYIIEHPENGGPVENFFNKSPFEGKIFDEKELDKSKRYLYATQEELNIVNV